MSSPAATAKDALYHLYIGSEWTGPYRFDEVRALLQNGEVQNDTFAYDPAQERHLTVEALIAEGARANPASASPAGITLNSSIFDDSLILPPAQPAQEFPLAIPELRSMYQAFLGLTEGRNGDPHELAHQLRKAQQAVSDALAARQTNTGDLYTLVNQIDEIADYLANRHQIPALWQLISEMEKVDLASETAHGIACANAVLTCLVDRAERHEPAVAPHSSMTMLLDVDDQDEHDSVATRKILLSARHEMHNAKQDVNALQEAYSQLEHTHHHDIAEAQRLLAAAEKARAEEHQGSEQAMAELRALAAEIHRLASEADIVGGADSALLSEVASLGNELASTDPSTLAYLAEDVLIRMVGRLRQLIDAPEDVAPLREELAKARAELAQAGAIASERDQLKQQYQEQCRSAERATAQARDREHRLRSMVTALEVTKELHQEVMGDLQGELRSAQSRVETMERELAAVRGEIRGSSTSQDARSQELRDEMQRMVEMRSMLEVRREELAHHLETSEAELARAQADTTAGEGSTAALAEKVNQLRQTFDVTKKRLNDQKDLAKRLEAELSSSRNETNELHGRSDDLSRELDEARSSLAVAKKRVEELNTAYGRLENERGALQQELANRKSTDTIRKAGSGEPQTTTDRFEKITTQLAEASKHADSLDHALNGERRKVLALAEAQVDAQKRIEDLTSERQILRSAADSLQSERSADHARHASALSLSIRASIESESRLKQAQEHIGALEARLATGAGVAGDDATAQLQAELAQARSDLAEAGSALAAAHAERDALAAQLRPGTAGDGADPALSAAVAARDEVHAKLMQTIGERDRLRRELDRMKNEVEAAAVEHRTALKSARDRLIDAQSRTAEIELLLTTERQGQGDARPEQLRSQLADSLKEQARLRDDLQRHAQQIERLNSGRPSDRDNQLIDLARATQQLSAEQERVQALTRSLVESLHAGETARSRSVDLQAKVAALGAEREQYQIECERLRAELADIRLQGLAGSVDAKALRADQEARQQTLAELERVTAELAELRGRMASGEKQEITLARIGAEQARIRTLEQQLSDAKADQLKNENMFSEARSRLVQVSSERDRLASEIEALKARPDYAEELRTVRRRLERARQRIRELRMERDQAIQSRESQAGSVHELTGQIERLRATQRAAAEALGLSPPAAGFESRSAMPLEVGSTSRLGVALQPLLSGPGENSSSQRGVPRALTRRIVGVDPPGSHGGFTSAFGRPSIPGLVSAEPQARDGADQAVKRPLQTRVIHAPRQSTQSVQGDPPRQARRSLWPWAVAAGAAAAVAGFMLLPPLLPCSSHGLVTATLTTVKAPIDGKVTFSDASLGSQSHFTQHFADIDNETIDTTMLAGLSSQKASLEARQAALLDELAQLKQRRLALLDGGATDGQKPVAQLFSWHPVPAPALIAPEAKSGQVVNGHDTLWNPLPGPMIAAATAAGSQLQEVQQRLGEMNDQLAQLAAGITEVAGKVQEESKRIETHRHASISTPQFEIFWRRQVADHTWVRSGDAIAKFTDPSTIIIEALVSERYLDHLSIGDIARVILLGDKRTIKGTIQSLLPANQAPENQAGSLPRQISGRFLLTIAIAPGQQAPTIGQGIKVIILGQDPGPVTNLMAWLYEAIRL